MIDQKRFQDEKDVNYNDFFQKVTKEYHLVEISQGNCKVISHGTTNELTSCTDIPKIITANKFHELIACDKVVACVYLRRDDANWTEATYIIVEPAIASILTKIINKQT